tara:strand:+ start:2667 stop:2855 length:189 start_codon:yes stop_codon:yes gene_type:complete
MPRTPAKPSYSLVGDLHGMQGSAVRVRLAPIYSWVMRHIKWCVLIGVILKAPLFEYFLYGMR